jgi:hypothetical protein
LRLAYSMTIKKAQGQTLSHVGLMLKDTVFSHYVALSQVTNSRNLHIVIPDTAVDTEGRRDGKIQNVVYTEVLS